MELIDREKLLKQPIDTANYPSNFVKHAPTVEAIPKDQYENRLKADMVAMLTEIQVEIEESENCGKAFHLGLQMASNIIQQKIDALRKVVDNGNDD